MVKWKVTSYFDFSEFVFKDGTSIQKYYEKLSQLNYNIEQVKNQYSNVSVWWGTYENRKKPLTVASAIDFWSNLQDTLRSKL